MSGETELEKLLQTMSPQLLDGEYVFVSIADAHYGDHAELQPFAVCQEAEGLTFVLLKAQADQFGLAYDSVLNGITLQVHSSLDAVGLTAAFSNQLATQGISANVIAGYYHDHIFVNTEHAQKALQALLELSTTQ